MSYIQEALVKKMQKQVADLEIDGYHKAISFGYSSGDVPKAYVLWHRDDEQGFMITNHTGEERLTFQTLGEVEGFIESLSESWNKALEEAKSMFEKELRDGNINITIVRK